MSKDVVGARSLQGLGRLDEHLEKKKKNKSFDCYHIVRMNQSGGTLKQKQLKAEEVFGGMHF